MRRISFEEEIIARRIGLEEGIREGRQERIRAEGVDRISPKVRRLQEIMTIVRLCRAFRISKQETAEHLRKNLNLSEEVAGKVTERFWRAEEIIMKDRKLPNVKFDQYEEE